MAQADSGEWSQAFERVGNYVDQLMLDMAWESRRYLGGIRDEIESEQLSDEEALQLIARSYSSARRSRKAHRKILRLLKKLDIPPGSFHMMFFTRSLILERIERARRVITRKSALSSGMFAARKELLVDALAESTPGSTPLDAVIESDPPKVARSRGIDPATA